MDTAKAAENEIPDRERAYDAFSLKSTGPIRDPMLRSGLALSGAQTTIDLWAKDKVSPLESDGILTAAETASLNLHGTYLVTLSACETGLKRGFAVAGAENLLMMLWQISDDDTVALMGAFYDRVLKMGNIPHDRSPQCRRGLWFVSARTKDCSMPSTAQGRLSLWGNGAVGNEIVDAKSNLAAPITTQ